jgi:tRNA modification GTPase
LKPPPDTIAAIASPAGRGAVGLVRISGAGVPGIAAAVLGSLPPPRRALYGPFRDAAGETIDAGIALYFPAPASFTGEDVLELQGHGGSVVLDLLMRRVLSLGCRPARPGEFSERAFLNGKIDVTQAEAVADLIDAGTAAAARAAVRSMQGEFAARIGALQSELTSLRVHVEAAIDFPDEDIDFLSTPAITSRLAGVLATFDAITAAARQGSLLREGFTVVIAGRPNAGKSSLLNRLVGDEVAIVAASPGTTRDLLHHRVALDGMLLNLIDTAGLRSAADAAEEEGIRRAVREIGRADHVLYVVDAGLDAALRDLPSALAELPGNVPLTVVFNKIDLTGTAPHVVAERAQPELTPPRIYLSAKSGAGLDLLRDHLRASAGYQGSEGGALSARRRHIDALQQAREWVQGGARTMQETRAVELFAEDLRLAQRALGEITGEFTSEDLLGAIFSGFCIGK